MGGEIMTEQEKQKIEDAKAELKSALKTIVSYMVEQTQEALKAMQAYPNKRIVEKAIHGKTPKIRKKYMKKILDWYRKQNP
jgi:hypothetical protein